MGNMGIPRGSQCVSVNAQGCNHQIGEASLVHRACSGFIGEFGVLGLGFLDEFNYSFQQLW